MKKSLLIIGIIFTSIAVNAQDDAISKFFDKYQDDEDFTQVNITSRMFGLFTDMEVNDEEDQEVLDAISKISGLKILVKEDTNNGKALYKEAFAKLPKGEFDDLMSIRDGDTDMKFMIKEKGNIISELLMIAGGDQQFFILSIVGDIDLKQISKLSSKMNIDGLKGLENLKDN
jgi:hypothetical protein